LRPQPSRSRSSLPPKGSTPYGSVAPSLPLFPPSRPCGSPKRNTTNPALASSTANASKLHDGGISVAKDLSRTSPEDACWRSTSTRTSSELHAPSTYEPYHFMIIFRFVPKDAPTPKSILLLMSSLRECDLEWIVYYCDIA